MAASSSDAAPHLADDDWGVSEVVGFLLTFGIISAILLVAMLGFNNAQQRAETRLVEIQGSSAAQRVASAAIDMALFVQDNPGAGQTSVALDLPAELQGISYSVLLCEDLPAIGQTNTCDDQDETGADWCEGNPCPYVMVTSFRGEPQRQSTFLLAGASFCAAPYNTAGGGSLLVVYYPLGSSPPSECIGLESEA